MNGDTQSPERESVHGRNVYWRSFITGIGKMNSYFFLDLDPLVLYEAKSVLRLLRPDWH